MGIKKFLSKSRTVSPVIGVIPMVAIIVILTTVIGTFVFGLGDQAGDATPQASFNFNYDGTQEITIAHESGDFITSDELSVIIPSGLTADTVSKKTSSDDGMNAGGTIVVKLAAGNKPEDGSQVRLI